MDLIEETHSCANKVDRTVVEIVASPRAPKQSDAARGIRFVLVAGRRLYQFRREFSLRRSYPFGTGVSLFLFLFAKLVQQEPL